MVAKQKSRTAQTQVSVRKKTSGSEGNRDSVPISRITALESEITKDLHSRFLDSMEQRYKEILTFVGFAFPAMTGMIYLLSKFEVVPGRTLSNDSIGPITFSTGCLLINFVLTWGVLYAMAMSYRYRYLQACVYKIEDTTGASKFVPISFRPKVTNSCVDRILFSFAPGLLQINIWVFIVLMFGVTAIYSYSNDGVVVPSHDAYIMCVPLGYILFMGFHYYPRKLEKLIRSLDQ